MTFNPEVSRVLMATTDTALHMLMFTIASLHIQS